MQFFSVSSVLILAAFFLQGILSMQTCSKGQFYNQTDDVCQSCPQGTYWNGDETTFQCTTCSSGYIASLPGASECVQCEAGTIAVGGTECKGCPAGTYEVDQSFCEKCPAGTFSIAGQSGRDACQACSAGEIAEFAGSGSCEKCYRGTYEENRTSCVKCPLGTHSWKTGCSGQDSCEACPAGYFTAHSGSSFCSKCDNGTYGVNGMTCEKCPAGTSSKSRSTSFDDCIECLSGEIAPLAGDYCQPCSWGTYEVNRTSCVKCPPGTSSPRFAVNGSESCKVCQEGYIAALPGAPICGPCIQGTYEVNRTTCVECPAGSISKFAATACEACPRGFIPHASFGWCERDPNFKEEAVYIYILGLIVVGAILLYVVVSRNKKKIADDIEDDKNLGINLVSHNDHSTY